MVNDGILSSKTINNVKSKIDTRIKGEKYNEEKIGYAFAICYIINSNVFSLSP